MPPWELFRKAYFSRLYWQTKSTGIHTCLLLNVFTECPHSFSVFFKKNNAVCNRILKRNHTSRPANYLSTLRSCRMGILTFISQILVWYTNHKYSSSNGALQQTILVLDLPASKWWCRSPRFIASFQNTGISSPVGHYTLLRPFPSTGYSPKMLRFFQNQSWRC